MDQTDSITESENRRWKEMFSIKLRNVKIAENENGEIDLDVSESPDMSKADEIHELNTSSAFENSQMWFGKQLTDDRTKKFYSKKSTITADEISATKIYDARKTTMPLVDLKIGSACTVLLEFSGLWFGKKTFGPSWNLVQAKLNPEPEPEVEKTPEDRGTRRKYGRGQSCRGALSRRMYDRRRRIKNYLYNI